MKPSVFVVDDEALAVRRLLRMLEATGRVVIAGSATDPVDAIEAIRRVGADALFLDIQMPGMTGFDLLEQLDPQPLVIFTTAYDQYALRAFDVNSIDYLLKPVEPPQLDRALQKLERMFGGSAPRPDVTSVIEQLRSALGGTAYPERISSRVGDRVEFLELSRITHFAARDKLTYAVTTTREHAVDPTIADLEQKLDPRRFVRIHRATLLNLDYVHEMYAWFGGRMMVRLKDEKRTELTVARDRVRVLKEKLGL